MKRDPYYDYRDLHCTPSWDKVLQSIVASKGASSGGTVVITDDMVRAACNAHGASQGACEFDWMRDALTAALAVGQSMTEPK